MTTINQQKSNSIVWLALGISLALVLLLNYSQVLTWDVWWRLLQTWPVALLAWWVEYMFNRRSNLGSILASGLLLFTVMVVVLLAELSSEAQDRCSIVQGYPSNSVTHVQMTLKQSVGQLDVGPQWDVEHLITVTLSPGRSERVYRRYTVAGNSASFALRAQRRFAPLFIGSGADHRWEVRVQPTVTVSLDASLGVGENTFDLRQLSVDRAALNFAIGTLDLTLPQEGVGKFDINGAIGKVSLAIPEGKSVRVYVETSLAACHFPETYIARDKMYLSPSCASSSSCTDVSIGLSVGEVLVVELSP